MMNIDNLNVEKDILPLFNMTLNYNSRSTLIQLLNTKPKTLQEVMDRQNIIRGFVQQIEGKSFYNYSKTEYNEVLNKINNVESVDFLKIKFYSSVKSTLKSLLTQLYIFFNKIYTFLQSLEVNLFPTKFRNLLNNMIATLMSIETEKIYQFIRNRKFKSKEILKANDLLIENKQEINLFFEQFHLFEAYLSISLKVIEHQFIFPTISSQNELDLVDFYYPLLKNPVKNNFKTSKNVIVLTGANMSGKSTFFRAIAFCSYLGNLGLPIPCKAATIPFYQTISINIDHTDNVLKGYSHFMNEIMNLKNYLISSKETGYSFAIFDELFSGTNSIDATNLLTKTIKGLDSHQNTLTFISTHLNEILGELQQLDNTEFLHLECIIEENTPVYTYKIKNGFSDIRVGQLIFEKEGLNELLKPVNL